MTSVEPPDGVLVERSDLTLLDTRAMPWKEFAGLAGGKVKVLTRDRQGTAGAMLVWMPPGDLPGVPLPHRHFHRSVHEYAYVVSGELPHWEYADASEREGAMVVYRSGYFMDRRPGSIHGLELGPTSATGCVLLMWRDGVGNWLDEPESAEETIEVPYDSVPGPGSDHGSTVGIRDDGRPGVVVERSDLTLLDTREMPWRDFDGLNGARIKVLAADGNGDHIVSLIWMPPSHREAAAPPHRHFHRSVHEYAYVVSGELPHWEYAEASEREGAMVVYRSGYFMDRRPGSIHGSEPGARSVTGCVLLMWRDGTGNWIGEPNAAEETIEVAYPNAVRR